jgi:hypothetical protein
MACSGEELVVLERLCCSVTWPMRSTGRRGGRDIIMSHGLD